MKLLIKLGGALLDTQESRSALASQIAQAAGQGHQIVVVHGGGKQMTRFLTERGIESRFVDGLRVTTPEVIDAVVKVVAGSVNQDLVASLIAQGVNAVGLSGVDACITEAEQMREDLGFVGRPVRSNPALLNLLVAHGYVPTVACVAGDRQGRIFNVNADQMAVSCASGFAAERLLFLTDVDGVRGGDGTVVRSLPVSDAAKLIADGVATGGMQAKLTAASIAIQGGVGQVIVAPGAMPGVVSKLLDGEPIGTRIVA